MPDHPPVRKKDLTDYQIEVLAWIAAGCTLAEVAEKLGKTRHAINSVTNIIRHKLDSRTIAQAVDVAWRRRILVHDDEESDQ